MLGNADVEDVTTNASSPAASGPAGSHFEGQAGASYLLALLTGSEPRGLPGTGVVSVQFQRADEGRPLDDIVVHARDMRAKAAVLEIQVKRTISFTPVDRVFRSVAAQIAKASQRVDFWSTRYELAIATARTSKKIDGAYQDVLTWARNLGDANTFFARINRTGSANDDMRRFVQTFRTHLSDVGVPSDDETLWRLLAKLQILIFDFIAQGSASEELANERAVRALHADDGARAGNLWSALIELSLKLAASGGECKRAELIDELRQQGFRFAGERRYASARSALAESSRHALDDIADRVGGAKLTRHELVSAMHSALEVSRYIEIRGDAGVGKSGLLKHFAQQVSAEAPVIVLRPGRTTPRGWTSMRGVIGFDGSARELLVDLAGDGGGILFVDNLDFFEPEERSTVVDLVREASDVPGFAVIATARRKFGVDEPSWLPVDALNRLGRTELVIDEPTAAEVEEIRQAAPRLAFLLADGHPARNLARNLFKLDRLAGSAADDEMPRSEVDMAERWWQTADGSRDEAHRERARVLRGLAEQALTHAEPLSVRGQPAAAVNALVESETLRELDDDRVAFHHDVLREWAIGNLLHVDPTLIERLELGQRSGPALSRGVELAARMRIERSGDSTEWQSLLERLSREGVHGSWRRAVLLALVRSEVSDEVLNRAADFLFANRAAGLRELIRLVMAVDAQPAAQLFASLGADIAIPSSINVPTGPSWQRLIVWLLLLGERLPAAAIPDVVDFYTAWSTGMFGLDPLTPHLQERLYRWLTEIETAREGETFQDRRAAFDGQIDYEQMRSLESDIRSTFLLFAKRSPELAARYLRALIRRRRGGNAMRSILKFRGTLAQAAPAELAELTAHTLIPKPDEQERDSQADRDPFDYVDHELLPASPAQGPFLELLIHSPQAGLSLIRRLVDHAISFYGRDREPGTDVVVIALPEGERSFPWARSYTWPRDAHGSYCVTSALMALEAWAHKRIEAGESFEQVLGDVVGPPGTCAAYLLVAVDLIISHWPQSSEVALPFMANPELLCLDSERQISDSFQYQDFAGVSAIRKEPSGSASIADLTKRQSRRVSLVYTIGQLALDGPSVLRDRLIALLREAAERVGAPEAKSTLADPRLMVIRALNLVDPANWREVTVKLPDGSQELGHQYVPPPEESRHLAALQAERIGGNANTSMQLALANALDRPCTPEFAADAIKWAQSASAKKDSADDSGWMREQAIVSAAMIAMRDGDAEVRAANVEWARGVFTSAMQRDADPAHRFRSGLRFNPVAIAFVGTIHAAKDHHAADEIRAILEVPARGDPAAAHGLGAAAQMLISIDARLPRAVLRCALAACIRRRRTRNRDEIGKVSDEDSSWPANDAAVDAEVAWLSGSVSEPVWPAFPEERPRQKRRLALRGSSAKQNSEPPPSPEYVDHQAAALWLNNAKSLGDVADNPWLREIVTAYAAWTMTANGAGLEANEDISNAPMEWNHAYFDLLALCLPGLSLPDIEKLALAPLASLPDESFFDAIADFVRSVDAVYFGERGLEESVAIGIRDRLAERLMRSGGWKRVAMPRSASIERHIAPAIAVLFFNQHGVVQPTQCYLLPKGIDRLAPFLPILEKLVGSGPSMFVALLTLNLLEVSPRASQLRFLIAAAGTWVNSYPDDSQFWVDYGIGRRLCVWLARVLDQDAMLLVTNDALRRDVERILSALIRIGVADATPLEQKVVARSEKSDLEGKRP